MSGTLFNTVSWTTDWSADGRMERVITERSLPHSLLPGHAAAPDGLGAHAMAHPEPLF